MSKSLGIGGATLSDFLRFDRREDLWQIGSCPKFQKVGLLITLEFTYDWLPLFADPSVPYTYTLGRILIPAGQGLKPASVQG